MWVCCIVDVVLFDFATAFDVPSHHLLVDKFKLLDICSSLIINWIVDFLIGRVMRVSVSSIRSNFMGVRSGVQQGSMLFFLFVNNLPTYVVSKCKFIAVDLKIYLKIRHRNIVVMSSEFSSSQRDINTIVHFASSWGLQHNAASRVLHVIVWSVNRDFISIY